MRKMNKILVSGAVCGILSVTLAAGVSAEYLSSFVTTTTTATAAEDITDEITDTDIPADSIIDIVEETTITPTREKIRTIRIQKTPKSRKIQSKPRTAAATQSFLWRELRF